MSKVYDPVIEPDPSGLVHLSDNYVARRQASHSIAKKQPQVKPDDNDIFGENFVSIVDGWYGTQT